MEQTVPSMLEDAESASGGVCLNPPTLLHKDLLQPDTSQLHANISIATRSEHTGSGATIHYVA